MEIERLIAQSTLVPRCITAPWTLGYFRHPSAPHLMEEIESLKGREGRATFVGLPENEANLSIAVKTLRQTDPQIKCSLLLHWADAIRWISTNDDFLNNDFQDVFVAVDSMLTLEQAENIRARWNPTWILIPKVGLDWEQLLTKRLFTNMRGHTLLWAPPADNPDGPFLSIDELEHHIRTLRVSHPLIKMSPVPEAWHIVSENGPIGPLIRPIYPVTPMSERTMALSVIIPVHTFESGASEAIQALCEAVDHWEDTSEVLVCLDGISWPSDLPKSPKIRIVELPRPQNCGPDWRPGFVRNYGAAISHCKNNGLLLFCDSDVKISVQLISALQTSMSQQWDFAQFAVNPSELQWPSTTSKVFAVRRFAFDDVGGFPEAFSQYGCEDNALAWKLLQARYNPTALPPRFAEHLRGRNEDDDGLFKMQRLSRSANLFYRLMISTDVHSIYWHFFSCLGERPGLFSTALRATLKRSYRFMPIRFAMKAFVFLLTLQQTDDRRQFLRGSLEAVLWSIRTLIAKIVRLAIAAYVAVVKRATSILQYSKSQLLRASYFIRGNLWRIPWTMAEPAHRIKANLWRIPWTLTEPGRIVKANLWFFKSPQGWIRKNWPWLYRTFVVRFEHKRETQK